jgi:hypothetical protein
MTTPSGAFSFAEDTTGKLPKNNTGIAWAQWKLSTTFGDKEGHPFRDQSIYDVAAQLAGGKIAPSQLPLRVWTKPEDGITYTLNNRSLAVYVLAGVRPYVVAASKSESVAIEKRLTEIIMEGGTPGLEFVPVLRKP